MLNQTWNQYVVKKGNKNIVLDTIINHSPISRADIAQQTGLNKGTVSSLVSELLEEKIIMEVGPGKSSGGRRPVMLLFNKVAGFTVGIDLGVNYLLGILTDLQGNIFEKKKVTYNDLSYEEIEALLFEVIDELIQKAPNSPYGVIGIGVGVPGTVNNHGEILLAPNLGWKNIDLKSVLEKKFNIPVKIENEANAGAYGEKRFGLGQNFDDMIYVSVGIGIGVGLVLSGKLYKGDNGFSGELGHMTIQAGGLKCRCGNEGCWELYASERALLNEAEKMGLTPDHDGKLSLEDLIELAENGQKEAIQLFDKIGYYLGVGVNNIINIFNPKQIIIGNRIASAEKWLSGAINKLMKTNTLWYQHDDIQISFSEQTTYSSALGMSALTIEEFLGPWDKQLVTQR
jgi:glucokinase-like ROK family protein